MREYLQQVIFSWWALVGIILGAIQLVEWVTGKSVPWLNSRLKVVLTVVILLMAQATAYFDLRQRLSSTEDKLNELKAEAAKDQSIDMTRPKFSVAVGMVAGGDYDAAQIVVVDVFVSNVGAPSFAKGWKLEFKPVDEDRTYDILSIEPFDKAIE